MTGTGDTGLLRELRNALRQYDVEATLDTDPATIPVLWAPVPGTVQREMVHVQHRAGQQAFHWEGQEWSVEHPHQLARHLADYIAALTPQPVERRWG